MACFDPVMAIQPLSKNANGKRPLVFVDKVNAVPEGRKVLVPCGRCIGCRLERSRQWALRCVHEASLYNQNCFITLTFNDESLSKWWERSITLEDFPLARVGGLCKSDFQNFMKRLRKRFPGQNIRYFHCGEYGSINERPHHHACLFNFRFDDLKPQVTDEGKTILISDTLSDLWPYGFASVGEVNFESAAYVARYVMKKWAKKKLKGKALFDAMMAFDNNDDVKLKDYITMSRRPGIGAKWIEQYSDDVYPKDFITIRGRKCRPPKYYDLKKELTNPEFVLELKKSRRAKAIASTDNSFERLKTRKKIAELDVSRLRRSYEASSV